MGPGNDEPLDFSGSIVVPDDASALERDRIALLVELQQKARAKTPSAPTPTFTAVPAPFPAGPAEPRRTTWPYLTVFLIVCLSLLGLFAALIPQQTLKPIPLANPNAAIVAGTEGGLLPTGTVNVQGVPQVLRGFRPGVIAVLPSGACNACGASVTNIAQQDVTYQLPLLILGPTSAANRLPAIAAMSGATLTGIDNHGLLSQGDSGRVMLYFVRSDGIITAITPATATTNVDALLVALTKPISSKAAATG